MPDRLLHLWRYYPVPPFQRYALSVQPAAPTPASPVPYQIVDRDPAVADSGYLHDFVAHMAQAQVVMRGQHGKVGGGIVIQDEIAEVGPGDPDHFGNAVRTVPGSAISGPRT